jgi:hypothetical protein
MFRRIAGLLLLLVGLLGAVVSFGGIYGVNQLFGAINRDLDTTVSTALVSGNETLGLVVETLQVTKQSLVEVNTAIDTVSRLASDVSRTVDDTGPLLQEVQRITTDDVPASLAAVQAAMPNIATTAGTIDQTLRVLDSFQFTQSLEFPPLLRIPPLEFGFNLGINYNPTEPFDKSVEQIGSSLEGLPERLRELGPTLDVTRENLDTLSSGVGTVSADLDRINIAVADFVPLIDQYILSLEQAQGGVENSRLSLTGSIVPTLNAIRIGVIALLVWLGIFQIIPLYIGYQMARGRSID